MKNIFYWLLNLIDCTKMSLNINYDINIHYVNIRIQRLYNIKTFYFKIFDDPKCKHEMKV